MDKRFFSTSEVALLLGISRQAIFKKIKSGEIKAVKAGRNFVISRKYLPEIMGKALTEKQKLEIQKSVDKTIREYSETLRLLGQE